jgi:hypothetical protein
MPHLSLNLQYCKRKLWTERCFAIQDTEGHNKVTTLFSYPAGTGVRRCWLCPFILVLPNKKWNDGFKWASTLCTKLHTKNIHLSRSRWLRGLKCRPAATCLLGLWVRISPGVWVFIYCKYSVLYWQKPLRQADLSSRGVLFNVYVLKSAITCKNNPLHVKCLGTRCQTEKYIQFDCCINVHLDRSGILVRE